MAEEAVARVEVDPVAVQVARLDERTVGLQRQMDARFDTLDKRFDGIDRRMDGLASKAELRVWGSLIMLLTTALFGVVLSK